MNYSARLPNSTFWADFFGPHLAGKNPRHGLAGDQPVLSRRPAVLRLALRLHGKLLPVL